MIQLLLNNLRDPQWTDGNGYRPKVLILDNEFFGSNLDAPVLQTSLLDFSTNEMLVDACIKHEPEAFALKDRFGRRDLTAESISKQWLEGQRLVDMYVQLTNVVNRS